MTWGMLNRNLNVYLYGSGGVKDIYWHNMAWRFDKCWLGELPVLPIDVYYESCVPDSKIKLYIDGYSVVFATHIMAYETMNRILVDEIAKDRLRKHESVLVKFAESLDEINPVVPPDIYHEIVSHYKKCRA